jgi:hypothetical protein
LGLGGEISAFTQVAQTSLEDIILGLETLPSGDPSDAIGFKEPFFAFLAGIRESYAEEMNKYRALQEKTKSVGILCNIRDSVNFMQRLSLSFYSLRQKC